MWVIFQKEVLTFFHSLAGYLVIGVFLLIIGLVLWVFPDYSLLNYNYATLNQLFEIGPLIFLFLIPAVCMRSFSEERSSGTLEILVTKPIRDWEILLGKYFGVIFLIVLAILPTVVYYYSIWTLGTPKGNIDGGEVLGSYLGLLLLGAAFASLGLLSSILTTNQVIAFLLGCFLCFTFYWSFYFFSKLPIFVGSLDDTIQKIGIDYHYRAISHGVIDSRDIIYFISLISGVLFLSYIILKSRQSSN